MNLLLAFKALFLGIIEGLTEFLPISSTGHLIVAGSLIGFDAESHVVFNIAIQLGAILAVVYEYRARFTHVLTHIGKDRLSNRFVLNLAIAFIPAAAIGLLLNDFIDKVLFNPVSVAAALVVGGFLILWIEKRQSRVPPKVRSVDDMRPRDALAVGLFQILALIPGTSRSGSTIMGGMVWGLDRKTATEFSFFLAVPIIVAASGYSILKKPQRLFLAGARPHRHRLCRRFCFRPHRRKSPAAFCIQQKFRALRLLPHHLRRHHPAHLAVRLGKLVEHPIRQGWLKQTHLSLFR